MSSYSTRTVSREYALGVIANRFYTADNDTLAEILFDLVGHESLNNFIVVDELEENT